MGVVWLQNQFYLKLQTTDKKNEIHLFRDDISPVSGRHIRSPMGMRSISVGYKEAGMKQSAVGAASFVI